MSGNLALRSPPSSPGDYHVKIKVRNGRIIRRMREVGIESVAELARLADVGYQAAVRLVGMQDIPTGRDGEWREPILRIAAILRCDPDDLFNEQQLTSKVARNTSETFMGVEGLAQLASGSVEQIEAKITAEKLMEKLSDRERFTVMAISNGATLEEAGKFTEIGEKWDVSRDRARQIYDKALRKMRNVKRGPRVI